MSQFSLQPGQLSFQSGKRLAHLAVHLTGDARAFLLSDRLQVGGQGTQFFARVTQRFFGPLPVSDVFRAPVPVLRSALVIAHGTGIDFRPDEFSIVTTQFQLELFYVTGSLRSGNPSTPLAGVGKQSPGIGRKQCFAVRVAEHFDHRRIGVRDPTVRRRVEKSDREPVE